MDENDVKSFSKIKLVIFENLLTQHDEIEIYNIYDGCWFY